MTYYILRKPFFRATEQIIFLKTFEVKFQIHSVYNLDDNFLRREEKRAIRITKNNEKGGGTEVENYLYQHFQCF